MQWVLRSYYMIDGEDSVLSSNGRVYRYLLFSTSTNPFNATCPWESVTRREYMLKIA
jgi:hypothetical protein